MQLVQIRRIFPYLQNSFRYLRVSFESSIRHDGMSADNDLVHSRHDGKYGRVCDDCGRYLGLCKRCGELMASIKWSGFGYNHLLVKNEGLLQKAQASINPST